MLLMKYLKLFVMLVFVLPLLSCDQFENFLSTALSLPGLTSAESIEQKKPISLLEKIKQRGKLIVLTTNLPTTYYYSRDNKYTGPEYDMAESFAASLNVKVEYKVLDSTKKIITALRANEGDIAAASLTITESRKKEFDFGPAYQTANEYLVCHRSKKRIKKAMDIKGVEIIVAADSSYINTLKTYSGASWTEDSDVNSEALLDQVAKKKIECTVSDSTLYSIERRYHTEIQNKFTLSKGSKLAWMINKNNDELLIMINNWFGEYKNNHGLAVMLEKYYGYVEIFDYVDTHKFLKRIKTRLPKYKNFFIDAAYKNSLKPSLLAAQSYQESHWDRKAKSPTGVRGIMMLTQPVAKSMGVTNRLHAEQNIYAGAKFQAKMKKMVVDVNEPDRSWLALAAYNVGRGHFRDAQSLARKLNKNPDHWADMKDVLPLLSQKKYYKKLRYGYARGNEPVRYVMRIRSYNELLNQHFDGEKFEGVK
ncbi:Membrane-bound lytic murein transglycosylase F (EC 4.2.2.n1) [hydrothermal vent metagenome]|uniref:Membrane-bound lytic murein transglycosylase F n=1 Tax=hydrothermal vent metagenome TaxID=652676 RepID=A0A3B0WA22_9ZZZZ